MTSDLDTLDEAALDRLTTLLVQSGHLSHPLHLQAFVETDLAHDDLKAALQDFLPAHMVPDALELVPKLARLPNGKLDRKALTKPSNDHASHTKIADADQEPADMDEQPLDVTMQGESARQMFILNANRPMLEQLNDQLESRRKLHLMTLHWGTGKVDSRTSVSGIAEEFIERIRRIQPVGPYSLGGFSMGAVAAHEIALKLQAQGEVINDLVMIDPPENPRLFAKVCNPDHIFEGSKKDDMTLKRRLVNRAVVSLAGLARALSLPIPDKIRRRLAGAAYTRAARRYQIREPAVSPVIVRRKISQTTSIWAGADQGFDLHQIACTHQDFHQDEATIEQWTGLLAQSLNGPKP